MKRKVIKVIAIILVVFAIFNIYLSYINRSFALGDVTKNPNIWINAEEEVGDNILNKKSRPITGIIRAFGVIASVVTLAIIALRIIFGSTEEKANYKQTLLPWAVGAVMLFSMATIPSLVYNAIEDGIGESKIEINKNRIGYGEFCINNSLMKVDYYNNEFKCYRESDDESCGCKHAHSLKLVERSGYYCLTCYEDSKEKAKRLQVVKVKGVEYYYCSGCGNLHEK